MIDRGERVLFARSIFKFLATQKDKFDAEEQFLKPEDLLKKVTG